VEWYPSRMLARSADIRVIAVSTALRLEATAAGLAARDVIALVRLFMATATIARGLAPGMLTVVGNQARESEMRLCRVLLTWTWKQR